MIYTNADIFWEHFLHYLF
uniref:Uncharacterized protein n=1 Tax=Anguilla anguilla TaxID=7936 RepID=A0A0E9V367_ANGAN